MPDPRYETGGKQLTNNVIGRRRFIDVGAKQQNSIGKIVPFLLHSFFDWIHDRPLQTVLKVSAIVEKSVPLYRGDNEFSILTGGTFTFKTVPLFGICVIKPERGHIH